MNLYCFLFMEAYKKFLISTIYNYRDKTLEDVEYSLKDEPTAIINRNEEGKMHSKYLGDRYEPAIILKFQCGSQIREEHYYLFDGNIRDCTHPFCVTYVGQETHVFYYSSERIKKGEPIYINNEESFYDIDKILDEYESDRIEGNKIKDFSLLCNKIDFNKIETFRFAD